jgi:hypothetical protein
MPDADVSLGQKRISLIGIGSTHRLDVRKLRGRDGQFEEFL